MRAKEQNIRCIQILCHLRFASCLDLQVELLLLCFCADTLRQKSAGQSSAAAEHYIQFAMCEISFF